jgi:hypothetical protein
MSSSGFVPLPLSNRDKNEKGPSNAPLPSFIVPLPSFSVPSHTADPVRVAIVLSPLLFVVMQAIMPAILADRIVCLIPLSAVAGERNAFSETKALAPVSAL